MSKLAVFFALVAIFSSAACASSTEDEGDWPLACPWSAKVLCSAHHYPHFTGTVECDKPVLCGDQKLFDREFAPLGVICEYDVEDPTRPTKVCNGEGKCTRFYHQRGDC